MDSEVKIFIKRSAQLAKFVLVSVLAILILAYNHGEYLYSFFVLGLHWCHLYLDVLAISAILARAIQGLELEPQFNEPYLSTSLQDFWGRRSYLMIRSILRPTVYIPIRCDARDDVFLSYTFQSHVGDYVVFCFSRGVHGSGGGGEEGGGW
ncbi:hypothetical protein ACSBR2_028380 [Camellia fascicularis]